MYSEDDINSAVSAGALSAEAAENFRSHMSKARKLPRGSEENFKLINSFNDIFVSIGIVILLVAVGAIGQAIAGMIVPVGQWDFETDFGNADWQASYALRESLQLGIAGLLVAAAAWPLSEFFIRRRRMALPSILLLLGFVGGTFFAIFGLGQALVASENPQVTALVAAGAGLVAAGAAYAHYRRFMVPITVAAGTAAIAGTIIALVMAAAGLWINTDIILALVFVAGLAVFTVAMRWDISDRERVTRRSDVAFWLHLLAAPMIAHPVFALIGVTQGDNIGIGAAISVVAVYIGFGLLALTVDRRALLVSALIYVLFALTFLFREFGAVELNFALTALVIGSALLSLSAFWQPIRRAVVTTLPENLQDKLPVTDDLQLAPRKASPA
jgi:hypothetical protein